MHQGLEIGLLLEKGTALSKNLKKCILVISKEKSKKEVRKINSEVINRMQMDKIISRNFKIRNQFFLHFFEFLVVELNIEL